MLPKQGLARVAAMPYGVFREREDTHGDFMLLYCIVTRRGIPLGVYPDRLLTLRRVRLVAAHMADTST